MCSRGRWGWARLGGRLSGPAGWPAGGQACGLKVALGLEGALGLGAVGVLRAFPVCIVIVDTAGNLCQYEFDTVAWWLGMKCKVSYKSRPESMT